MKKRIALPTSDRTRVDEHFGHAQEFAFADIDGDTPVSISYLTPPPHAPGVIPRFVGEQGADVIVTGGMGSMAVRLFEEQGIEVILGVTGTIDAVLAAYRAGELESTGSVCNHSHSH